MTDQKISGSRLLKKRLLFGLFAVVAGLLTLLVHANYASPLYGYLGMPYVPLSLGGFILLGSFSALPAMLLPIYNKRVSSILVWILFFYCYVPTITLFIASGLLPRAILIGYLVSYCVGMLLIISSSHFNWNRIKRIPLSAGIFWFCIFGLFGAFVFWIVIANYQTMALVGMRDVYEQRFLGGASVGTSAYAMGNLSGAINPILMAYGLSSRRRSLFVLGALGQLLTYSVMAHKFVLLSVIYLPVFYYTVFGRFAGLRGSYSSLTPIAVTFFCVVLVGFASVAASSFFSGVFWEDIAALLLMRLIALPGALGAQYALFFEDNPLTYMTHVGLGRLFFSSPYADPVSIVMGYFLNNGDRGLNANVNFFAFDGTASFGMIGPAFMGLIVAFTLRLLNGMFHSRSLLMGSLSIIPLAFTLSESSFFTTMLTGGGALLFLLLFLMPADEVDLVPGSLKDEN